MELISTVAAVYLVIFPDNVAIKVPMNNMEACE
ncbi:MAG: hypothetical protein CFH41_00786 [Alphaproteobacteria bacterium MarineAlpha11_Bin1]|nr:MAG: hypothetical protein CFH41_00786 [Alphaproteobacteria bacterium MarineAlpha11_Bin1]